MEEQNLQEPIENETTDSPNLSLIQTLTDIFFEPSKVFESLRIFPRFLVVALISIILAFVFGACFTQKLGMERIMREQLNMSFMQSIPQEEKAKMIEQAKNTTTARMILNNGVGIIFWVLLFAFLGLVYWGSGLALGGEGKYWHGLAIACYSYFPQILITMTGSLIILYLKSADEISLLDSQNMLKASPAFFLNPKETPVISAILSSFDIFALWGWFLASTGLQKCMRVSSAGAWGIVLFLFLIGVGIRVLGAFFV